MRTFLVGLLSLGFVCPQASKGSWVPKLNDEHFKIETLSKSDFRIINRASGFEYSLKIWTDLSKKGVRLYYEQALESMPRIWVDREFDFVHQEVNGYYRGYTYSLDGDWIMEFVRDLKPGIGIRLMGVGRESENLNRLHDILYLINRLGLESKPSKR